MARPKLMFFFLLLFFGVTRRVSPVSRGGRFLSSGHKFHNVRSVGRGNWRTCCENGWNGCGASCAVILWSCLYWTFKLILVLAWYRVLVWILLGCSMWRARPRRRARVLLSHRQVPRNRISYPWLAGECVSGNTDHVTPAIISGSTTKTSTFSRSS